MESKFVERARCTTHKRIRVEQDESRKIGLRTLLSRMQVAESHKSSTQAHAKDNSRINEAKTLGLLRKTHSSRDGKSKRRWRRWRSRASARWEGMRSRVRLCLLHLSTATELAVAASMHMRTNKLSMVSTISKFSCDLLLEKKWIWIYCTVWIDDGEFKRNNRLRILTEMTK